MSHCCADNPARPRQLLKSLISTAGIPIEMQRLMFSGKQLEDGQSLADCGVQQESNLYMVVRDCGKW